MTAYQLIVMAGKGCLIAVGGILALFASLGLFATIVQMAYELHAPKKESKGW